MISQKARYALRALLFIAARDDGPPVQLSQMVEENNISQKYLQLVLLDLKRNGLVSSQRGRSGGYRLKRPAREISFANILRVTDGPIALSSCISDTGYRKCTDCFDEKVCAIRAALLETRKKTASVLESYDLESAAQALRSAGAL